MSRPPSPSQSIRDPTERWEKIRAEWLSTSSSSSSDSVPRKPKDAVFSQRIKTLEELLRSANAGETASPPASSSSFGRAGSDAVPNLIETGTASLSLDPKGKARETEPELEELPDDGFAVGGERRGSTQELKKISEVSAPVWASRVALLDLSDAACNVCPGNLSRVQAGQSAQRSVAVVPRRKLGFPFSPPTSLRPSQADPPFYARRDRLTIRDTSPQIPIASAILRLAVPDFVAFSQLADRRHDPRQLLSLASRTRPGDASPARSTDTSARLGRGGRGRRRRYDGRSAGVFAFAIASRPLVRDEPSRRDSDAV